MLDCLSIHAALGAVLRVAKAVFDVHTGLANVATDVEPHMVSNILPKRDVLPTVLAHLW